MRAVARFFARLAQNRNQILDQCARGAPACEIARALAGDSSVRATIAVNCPIPPQPG
jgi:hypothetical protein